MNMVARRGSGWRLSMLFAALALVCGTVAAQVASARLEGVVRDPSGAVVPGAAVQVVNTRTGVQAAGETNPEGVFVFAALQPGVYELRVQAQGFKQVVIRDLELYAAATRREPVQLEIGSTKETIEVLASSEVVNVTDAQIGQSVTLRDIAILPQLARSPVSLAVFATGVQYDPSDYTASRIQGTRMGSTTHRIDGIEANETVMPRLGLTVTPANSDSIAEFTIVTSGGKAEYGRNAGGQVELVTRSGTNAWHGGAFDYHRNKVLNANTFFNNAAGVVRPAYLQNLFGAFTGGSLRRERTFIFANYQGQRTSYGVPRNRLVLTKDAKEGIFGWPDNNGVIQKFDIVVSDPRGKGIDPQIAAILKLLPAGNNNNVSGQDTLNTKGFLFNSPYHQSGNQATVRLDHTLNSAHKLFLRGNWMGVWYTDAVGLADARFPGRPEGIQKGRNLTLVSGWDWTTPRRMNEFRVGYKYYFWDYLRRERIDGPMLLANSWTDPLNPMFPFGGKAPVLQFVDSGTIVRGTHTFKGGIDLRRTRMWARDGADPQITSRSGMWPNVFFEPAYNNPKLLIPESAIPGIDSNAILNFRQRLYSLYNDLLGRVSRVTQTLYSDLDTFQAAGTPRIRDFGFRDFAAFFQDDWKLHPRLTLNFGLRYEYFGLPVEVNGLQAVVTRAAAINSVIPITNLTVRRSSRWYDPDSNNFAPRIGFAWDPAGNRKTSLRANWGIFYDRINDGARRMVDGGTPGLSQRLQDTPNFPVSRDFRISDGLSALAQPPVPQLTPEAKRSTDLVLFSPGLRTGYVQQYSLTFEREIFRNTLIDAGYVGNRGIKLFMNLNLNQLRIYEDFLPAFLELRDKGLATPSSNTLVNIFGTPKDAINALGADFRAAGKAAEILDTTPMYYSLYGSRNIPATYLRNYPQFQKVIVGTNDGRSYYDSFQFSLRRQSGALKFVANYTFSKIVDNISVDGNTFVSPIDNFNLKLNRARGDYDIPHAFNGTFSYSLPFGKARRFGGNFGRWAETLLGGWDTGLLAVWQSGRVFSCTSGVATGPLPENSFADYSGDHGIGAIRRTADGVYWFTKDEAKLFTVPKAGETGTGGRNGFRGPRYFDIDMSLVKRFRLAEEHSATLRLEAYNLFNNTNFSTPNADLASSSFGKIGSTVPSSTARILQFVLRYDF